MFKTEAPMAVSAVGRALTASSFYISIIAIVMSGCCYDVMQDTATTKAIPAISLG